MKISRHATNNMRLYNISEKDISEAIESADVEEIEGNKLVALKQFKNRFSGYPLKVVYERMANQLFIVTAYPLKKKMGR